MTAPSTEPAREPRLRRVRLGLLLLVAGVLLAWALKAGRVVLMPLVLSFFLALLLHPVQAAVARRVPRRLRFLGLLSAVLALLLGLGVLGGAVALAAAAVKREAPALKQAFTERAQQARAWAEAHELPVPGAGGVAGAEGGGGESPARRLTQEAPRVLGGVAGGLLEAVLVLFFVLMMLLEAPHWEAKARRALPAHVADQALQVAHETGKRMRRYLVAVTVVGAVSGVAQGVWLSTMGVKLAVVWGLLFLVLNYIPALGSIIAGVPPVLFALMTLSPGKALLVAVGVLVIEQVTGNLIAPMVEGRGVSLSPLVVLFSVVLWEFLWGPVGAVLAVPIMATVLTACRHGPQLRPVAVLLGEGKGEVQEDAGAREAGARMR